MFSLYWWALSSITGSILGSATNAWFKKTKMGRWFYKKIENWYTWAANRYGFEILKAEDKWRKKFPNVAREIKYLEDYKNNDLVLQLAMENSIRLIKL